MHRTTALFASLLCLLAILLLMPQPASTERKQPESVTQKQLPFTQPSSDAKPIPGLLSQGLAMLTPPLLPQEAQGGMAGTPTSYIPHSLSLNGTNAYVRVPNSSSFNLTETITVDAWIKPNTISLQGIVERYRWLGNDDGGFALRLNAQGKLQFYTIRNNTVNDAVTGATTVSVGAWHHVAGVFDGNELRVYVDGALDGTKPSSVAPAPGTNDLRIGVVGDTDAYFFNGLIDEARVTSGVRYTGSFTPERQLITCKAVVEADGIGCRGVWTFDQQTAQDSTSFQNHGILMGGALFSTETNNLQFEEEVLVSLESASSSAPFGEQRYIHFDELGQGAIVNNRYPDLMFSARGNLNVITYNGSLVSGAGSSPLNIISVASSRFNTDLGVDFPKPVDNLIFRYVGQDDHGTIALVDIYQDFAYKATRPMSGFGRTNQALQYNIGAEFNHVTGLLFHHITDKAGIGFDDFVFNLPYVPPPIPAAPTNLRVIGVYALKLDIEWNDNATNEAGYKVERCAGQGCVNFSQIATLNPNIRQFRDPNVIVNTPYTYRVRAFNDGGHSNYSNPITGTPTLNTPVDLEANALSASKIALKWSAAGGFEHQGFALERSTDGINFKHVRNIAPLNRTFEDNPVEGGTTYHYRIRAYINDRFSDYSNIAIVTTAACDYNPYLGPGETFKAPASFQAYGWTGSVDISEDDGMRLFGLSLNNRLAAAQISIPYYTLETSLFGPVRGEIKANSSDTVLRSKLIKFVGESDRVKGWYEAVYAIDRLPNNSTSCFLITQRYEFYKQVEGERCEPSGSLPCARFRASVKYEFRGKGGEQLKTINIVQRTHYQIDGIKKNTVGLFLDCDTITNLLCIRSGNPGFERVENPLRTEIDLRAVIEGRRGEMDNHHQTWAEDRVTPPAEFPTFTASRSPIRPGCPECWHSHWRWGSIIPLAEGGGSLIRIHPNSRQDMNLAVTKFKPGEDDPIDYKQFVNPNESIRRVSSAGGAFIDNGTGGVGLSEEISTPEEVVYWLSATGKQAEDKFFDFGGYFNPTSKDERLDAVRKAQGGNAPAQLSAGSSEDKPSSVVFAYLYKSGVLEFTDVNPTSVAPLPAGYTVHNNNNAFNLETTAVTSGDNTVSFSVPSATDQTVFNKLRILHAELDALDKQKIIWVDRTILAPNAPAPNFANKTISAKTTFLGTFLIAQKADQPPVVVRNADLAITGNRAPEQLVSGNNLTYTLNVTNNGPEVAPDVNLVDDFSLNETFVSATPEQGSCSPSQGARVTCKFGDMNPGARVSVTIVLKVNDGEIPLPAEGRMIANSSYVVARANDTNFGNNQLILSTRALPDPNPPPTVKLLTPAPNSLFVGPTSVTITSEATDPNGNISKVEIYDGNQLIGTSSPAGANQFSFTWANVPFGKHSLAAVATDNQGRSAVSGQANIIINGSATVAVTSPTNGVGFISPASVQVTAQASVASGSIAKVEFFANFYSIGSVTVPNGNQYSVTWTDATPDFYNLTAVVTDNAGITTTSAPVKVSIIDPATVNILDPLNDATFTASPSIVIKAEARNSSGTIAKVEFYANGALIGTDASAGVGQYFVDWNNIPDGIYQLTAVATDNFGQRTTSPPVQIVVNVSSPEPGELIWFDDALPAGASPLSTPNDGWHWVDANPAAILNRKAHQSRNSNDFHQHSFENASFKLPINAGDTIFTYVFLDPTAMPWEIMLEWKAEDGAEHRAYWGLNKIDHLGANGTNSRRFMGALPAPGRWVRLEIPVESVGLADKTLSGMSFILFGGKATFDRTGKTAEPPAPAPAPGDVVWFDDALPAGALIPSDERVMKDDSWIWLGANPSPKAGALYHRTFQSTDNETPVYRSHAFFGASAPLVIRPGDVLFTHVYLDPDPKYRPDQIILQWYDGNNWEHRAYWGSSYKTFGRMGTESQRYMGGIPDSGRWVRLEIPASYVGLEGKSVSGMSFGVNRERRLARAAWDLTGKSTQITVPVIPMQSTVPIYRFFNSNEGYSYWINDIGLGNRIPQGAQWHVHPNQAAGTVPFYRFRHVSSGQYIYTQFRDGPSKPDANWTEDTDAFGSSVSFYIYPDNTTPGVAPLLLYRDPNNLNYFYTANPNDPATASMNGPCANNSPCTTGFVNATSPMQSPLPNPIDDTQFFVRQHYLDFFNREPDAGGLSFWSNDINKCSNPAERGANEPEAACIERKRADVSAAFFYSIEFQETGYVLHRMHKASYGSLPVYQQFMPDLRTIGQGVVVLQPGWQQLLESNKRAFFDQWVTRTEFRAIFDSKTNAEYVDLLFANAGVGPQTERDALVQGLTSSTETRATVLRKVAEGNEAFKQSEFNRAFVLMQYFGYLRRHPSDLPDVDMRGYDFWLTKLNEHNGDWRRAEMVQSFLVSIEYRGRFGQPAPPVSANSFVAGQNVSVKSGVVTSKFSMAANSGVMLVMPTAPWAMGPPPEGYTFYSNVGYMMATSSSVSPPITLNVNLAWQVDDPVVFSSLRILNREGDVWVDRTILAPNTPGPDFASRTLSASVNSLSTFAIARVVSSNLAPSVTITSPTAGQDFHQPASVVINASASDAGGSISKVEFFQNDTLLGADTAAPYSLTWNNVLAGSYTLTVRATDNGGVTTTSAGVGIIVHGPPAVIITAPANNTTSNAPASFTVSASASDPDGIKQVEFFQGAVSLGVDTTAPFEVSWNGVGVGTFSLTARATDNLNVTAASAPTIVTISNTAPNVVITSPSNGTMAGNAPASITINASANDSNGISKVEFFQGATKLGEDLTAPYSYTWANVASGSYSLTARATDTLGAATTSSVVNVTVAVPPNQPPVANAGGPYTGTTNTAIQLNGSGSSDPDGTIASYQWDFGDGASGTGVNPTHAYTSAGSYTAKLTVKDNAGASHTAQALVTVNAPSNGATFISQSVSGTMITGRPYQVSVTFKNTGTTTWTAATNYNLGSQNPQDNTTWSMARVALPSSVAPGNQVTFTFNVTAPAAAGSYNFQWRMVQDTVAWFGDLSTTASVLVSAPASVGLIAHWKFDEASGLTTADATGNGNTATLQGSTWGAGKVGAGALSFDGIDDRVTVASNANLNELANNFTLSFWAYPRSTHGIDAEGSQLAGVSGQKYAFEPRYKADPNAGAGISVGTNGVSVYEHAGNYMPALLVYQAPLTGWTHITVVYENKQPKLYINGTLVRTGLTSSRSNVLIYPQDMGGMPYGSYDGLMDEVRVYNKALSAVDVQNIATEFPVPVGYWRFDEGSGTIAADSYNNGNDAVLQNGVVWANGKMNKALGFDGVNDDVKVGAQPSLAMSKQMTLGAWVYSTGSGGMIVNREGEYEFALMADGSVQWAFANTNPGWNWINTGYLVPLNQWTHLTFVYDNGVVKTYANGSLVHTYNGAGLIGDAIPAQNEFRIGGRQCCAQFFKGRLDEVRVYNSALRPEQVSALAAVGKIVFTSARDGNSEIYVMNADGSNQTRLTNHAAADAFPAWSPDGTKILFESTRDGNNEIYVMNADGSNQVNLTNNAALDLCPAWSPDGTKIAFHTTRDGQREIYSMNADGTNPVRLTNIATNEFHVSWSPDGTKILFATNREGNNEIYVMNSDGSNQINLSQNPAHEHFPTWSPDGTKIAFSSGRDGNEEIYLMNADGTGQVNLTNNPASEQRRPAWSADGSKIAFASNRDGNDELYLMNANGSLQARLTSNPASELDPAWQRNTGINRLPAANAGGPYTGQLNTAIQFNGSGSTDTDGTIVRYSWDFGDGASGTGANPTHAYAASGNYTARLTVTDEVGAMASATASVSIAAPPPANGATFVSQSIPSSMIVGQTYTVSVTMRNAGTTTWTSAANYMLGTQNPQDNTIWGNTAPGLGRTALPSSIAPNTDATFTFSITAPSAPGSYNFQRRMLQNGVEWFGALTPNVVVTVTAPPTATAKAAYVKTDTTTQGNWKGIYGGDGYAVSSEIYLPQYAQVGAAGTSHTWAASTADVRALQKPSSTSDRIAFCQYSANFFTIDVNLTDGLTHQLALYVLDWDSAGPRQQRIEVLDGATGVVLDTRTVSDFANGHYLVWNLSGYVKIKLTNLGSSTSNAVVSGLFFDTTPMAHWAFDEGSGTSATDITGKGNTGSLLGPTWSAGKVGAGALNFDGLDDRVTVASNASLSGVVNNFTVSFWAYPRSTHEIDVESTTGSAGSSGQRYAFEPRFKNDASAGAGISVGTNGISVYEHAYAYMPPLLVYPSPLTAWTHITVVYENKQPKLYVNGLLVRTGLQSPRSSVFLQPQDIGGMAYGYFDGLMDDVRVYNQALGAAEVRQIAQGMPIKHMALNRPATQSSTYPDPLNPKADRATDGNTSGDFFASNVTHTNNENQPWWQVDLGATASIQNITLWNRTDCCATRLSNFYVFVSDVPFTGSDTTSIVNQPGVSNYPISTFSGPSLTVPINRTGRYVRVQLAGLGTLSLAEVQVWGQPPGWPIFGDDYNDNALDTSKWTVIDPASSLQVREQNQRLEMALQPSTAAYNGVSSAATLDLISRALQVEVVQATSMGGWTETYFQAKLDDNNYYHMSCDTGSFIMDAWSGGVRDRTALSYNPVAHRFWRFRHDAVANTMNFELSPDGQTWTTGKTVPVSFNINAMRLYLMARAWGTGNSTPGTAIFDNLRLDKK